MKNLEDIIWNDNINNTDENCLNGEGEFPKILSFYCLEICCTSVSETPPPASTFGCKE